MKIVHHYWAYWVKKRRKHYSDIVIAPVVVVLLPVWCCDLDQCEDYETIQTGNPGLNSCFVFSLCLFLMTAAWAGGEWFLSVNMADHHTSSHMPASMRGGCSLSWTKWKVHAPEPDKWFVCLPDRQPCVTDLFVCAHLQRDFPLSLQGVLVKNVQSGLQRQSPMWLPARTWTGVTWPRVLCAHMHALRSILHSPFSGGWTTSQPLPAHLNLCYTRWV